MIFNEHIGQRHLVIRFELPLRVVNSQNAERLLFRPRKLAMYYHSQCYDVNQGGWKKEAVLSSLPARRLEGSLA